MAVLPKTTGRRVYISDDGKRRFSGATTIMGEHLGWGRHGLIQWAYREGCKARDEIGELEAAIKANRHNAKRDKAAAKGTLAHAFLEHAHNGTAVDVGEHSQEEIARSRELAEKADGMLRAHGLKVKHVELAMTHEVPGPPSVGFGGTLDVICVDADDKLVLADLKTGKDVYDEVTIQLGAYAFLHEVNGLGRIDRALVINTPFDKPSKAIEVSRTKLDAGAAIFIALLGIHAMKDAAALS